MKRAAIIGLVMGLSAWLAASAHAEERAGAAEMVNGRVLLTRGDVVSVLRAGASVHVGDRIRTGVDGNIRIRFVDDSTVRLAPNAHLEISDFMFEAQRSRRTSLRLMAGRFRARVAEALSAEDEFEVSTPTAVAGVRGTDFVVGVSGSEGSGFETEVGVFSGIVAVADSEGRSEVILHQGMATKVGPGEPPQQPREMTPEERREKEQETTRETETEKESETARRSERPEGYYEPMKEGEAFSPEPPEPPRTLEIKPPIPQQPTDRRGRTPVTIEIQRQP